MRRHLTSLAVAGAATAALAALVATSLLFANADGAEAVAEDAAVQLRAEETLSAATVARSLLREAFILGMARGSGAENETVLQAVIDQAETTLAETGRRVDGLAAEIGGDTTGLETAATEFVSSSRELIDVLARDQAADAVDAHFQSVAVSFDELTAVLIEERDARERHIAAVRAGVGDVARAARFLVAFLMPAAMVVAVLALVRQRQRRVLRQQEARRRTQLRQARDEFLTAVAHELRTPLTAVVSSAQMLRSGTEPLDVSTRQEVIDILADQSVELTDLVENLLVFARTNVGELALQAQVVDLPTVVRKITTAWGDDDLGRLTVRGEAEVWADPLRLKQVLRNLLSNALRHGGERIEIRIVSGEPNVLIQVADDGDAIPEQLRSRMFDPYVHGDPSSRPATLGLGLTVARSLTHRMGGELTYEARPGESLFSLTLPAARLHVGRAAEPVPAVEVRARRRISPAQVGEVIEQGRVDVVFQPIVELSHTDAPHAVVGAEALARFPVGSPQEWFEAAGTDGVRQQLELVAIRSAIQAFSSWEGQLFVSINLSFETLMSPQLRDALSGLEPSRVVLELTEASIINHYHEAGRRIALLRARGYRLAVDDMGTADTDLWHLVRLRPAFVKPDISLIRDGDLDAHRRSVMTGLRWLARTLPIRLIVEGVEREEDVESLRRLRIEWAQGFLFGRPESLPVTGSTRQARPARRRDGRPAVVVPPPPPPKRGYLIPDAETDESIDHHTR